MTSVFDPNVLLEATLTEPSERRQPLPVGDYTAVIGEITASTWQSKKDPTKSGVRWVVPLSIEVPPDVAEAIGLTSNVLPMTDSIMLELNSANMIDNSPGKNSRLRMYREAVDMNKPGDAFSAKRMVGQAILVKIEHEEYEGNLVDRIGKVAKLS